MCGFICWFPRTTATMTAALKMNVYDRTEKAFLDRLQSNVCCRAVHPLIYRRGIFFFVFVFQKQSLQYFILFIIFFM